MYVCKFNVLICIGVEVKYVVCNMGKLGFVVEMLDGMIEVNCVVVVMGLF